MKDIATKKKKVLAYIKKHLALLDPKKTNIKRYEDMFAKMNDKQFHGFMINMKEGKWQFHMYLPNMDKRPSIDNILAAADSCGCELFHRIEMEHPATGKSYITKTKYPVLELPVRRLQQYLDKKLAVPDSDKKIDGMTGQVTGDDKSAGITNPEIQGLNARGLTNTLTEVVTVRGGNIGAYGEFKRQLEETGMASLGDIESNSVTRSTIIAQTYLEAMHLENNLVDKGDSDG